MDFPSQAQGMNNPIGRRGGEGKASELNDLLSGTSKGSFPKGS